MTCYNTAEQLDSQAPQGILGRVPGRLHFVDPFTDGLVAH